MIMNTKTFCFGMTLIYALAFMSVTASSISKRNLQLIPTLTVDIHPPYSQISTSFDTIKEYHFPVGKMFNLSCDIKHPKFKFSIEIKRKQLLNNGTIAASSNLLGTNYVLHPSLDKERHTVEDFEYTDAYDLTAKHFRVSVIIRNLQIEDSGMYMCEYHNISKQIKVVVFKQALSKNIEFPINSLKSVTLNKPSTIGCQVSKVYPKPTISFELPNGDKIKQGAINVTDLSPSNTSSVYMYTELNEVSITPKFIDHNKNMTCSVFSIGSSNLTVQKSLTLNVEGFEIITSSCTKYFEADIGDTDVEYSCEFFSNPKVEPEWFTNQKSLVEEVAEKATELKDKAKEISSGIVSDMKIDFDDNTEEKFSDNLAKGVEAINEAASTIKPVVKSAKKSIENIVQIATQETDKSNYYSSLEEVGNGVFKAILKIKKVTAEDYKDFKLKFIFNGVETEHVAQMKKIGYKKLESLLNNINSAALISNNVVHSTIFVALSSLFMCLIR